MSRYRTLFKRAGRLRVQYLFHLFFRMKLVNLVNDVYLWLGLEGKFPYLILTY